MELYLLFNYYAILFWHSYGILNLECLYGLLYYDILWYMYVILYYCYDILQYYLLVLPLQQ